MPIIKHNGVQVTAGQALDVWLAYDKAEHPGQSIHLFADALLGFRTPLEILLKAGIKIQFGDSQE